MKSDFESIAIRAAWTGVFSRAPPSHRVASNAIVPISPTATRSPCSHSVFVLAYYD
jgi:hypothetical protein